MRGPVAPRDPEKKRPFYYLMKEKAIFGSPTPGGTGIQFIFLDGERLISASKFTGNLTDESMIELLKTAQGFHKMIHSVGVIVEGCDRAEECTFVFQFYGKTDPNNGGTVLRRPIRCDGSEQVMSLAEIELTDEDNVVGQCRFEFAHARVQASTTVKLYLNDGFTAPPQESDEPADLTSETFRKYLKNSVMNVGNAHRFQKALEKAKRGEDTTIAFIGGSITQGAGAIPINKECYAYKTYQAFCSLTGRSDCNNIHYVKAGVGGTPSELGMLRYDRDVRNGGEVDPDVVVVEFAVNDEGDETKGVCFESLVRKILKGKNDPAVIILFSVFATDYNLEERLSPVGFAYDLPMVSLKQCLTEQFYLTRETGKCVTKAQYFYDVYHPTNLGHTVMTKCIEQVMKELAEAPAREDTDFAKAQSPIGTAFEDVFLLDRKEQTVPVTIEEGDFSATDVDLQRVEMNLDLTGTPEFPYNWRFDAKANPNGFANPFVLEVDAKAILVIHKDSGSIEEGTVDVFVDGEFARKLDPHLNGWTHCNPLIVYQGEECAHHRVEIRMSKGEEHKSATILGFGLVR